MAEQNEPQGTDAEYQPRTRRERRELEKRSRKAVRAQNSENAADATGAPSGRRFGRHAKYSSDASGTESQSANGNGGIRQRAYPRDGNITSGTVRLVAAVQVRPPCCP